MAFIVIEGLDGSGKSTQLKILMDHLERKGIRYKYLHFPRTGSPVYGELIAAFLRGDLGPLEAVNPYLVALIYAGDRMDASSQVRKWLAEGFLVIADRYVHSNIAFQCAKLPAGEQQQLWDWILHLEYEYHGIPRPDLSIFLDVPFGFTTEKLKEDRKGTDRKYLGGGRDIHEEDLHFQERVREVYHRIAERDQSLVQVDCSAKEGRVLPPQEIFERLIGRLNSIFQMNKSD